MGVLLFAFGLAVAADPTPGFHEEVRVAEPTRLDVAFAAAPFAAAPFAAAPLPAAYESRRQRYQFFVPTGHDARKPAPLVVFVSPGDDPLGWPAWRLVCEKNALLFCAAYGAGNGCPPTQRLRIILDVLDDVRRRCRVDPDRTYLCGLGGSGRIACGIAYALPEYCGGVVALAGAGPLSRHDWLRHRAADRLSVAFVVADGDGRRAEVEALHEPAARAASLRSRLWTTAKLGHALPPSDVLAEAVAWLEEDRPRRVADSATDLGASPDDVPDIGRASARQLRAAEKALTKADGIGRGTALLRGLRLRWPNTEAGDAAQRLLQEIADNPTKARAAAEESAKEERLLLTTQARGLEQLGEGRAALEAWQQVAKQHGTTEERRAAATAARRLATTLERTPYLGIVFASENSLLIAETVANGPAAKAGLKVGDRVTGVGGRPIANAAVLRDTLAQYRPGDTLNLHLTRGGATLTAAVELGSALGDEKPR